MAESESHQYSETGITPLVLGSRIPQFCQSQSVTHHAFLLGRQRLSAESNRARARAAAARGTLAIQRALLKLHQLLQCGDHRRVQCGRLRDPMKTNHREA